MQVLPEGFLSLHEAAELVEHVLFTGKLESEAVRELRAGGLDVREREARAASIQVLWKGVDEKRLNAFALLGAKIAQLSSEQTQGIPMLRNSSGGSFVYLRPNHPAHDGMFKWFGADLTQASLAFKREEVRKYASHVLRSRRVARTTGTKRGRPGFGLALQTMIREIIERGEWNTTHSYKALASKLARRLVPRASVSERTVRRVLDELYEETKDRRFRRISANGSSPRIPYVLAQRRAVKSIRKRRRPAGALATLQALHDGIKHRLADVRHSTSGSRDALRPRCKNLLGLASSPLLRRPAR